MPSKSITYTCKTHPDKRWLKREGSPVIAFTGELGKQPHHGLIPPFKQAVKDIVSGKAAKRDEPIEFAPQALRDVAIRYVEWEDVYAFECDCPNDHIVPLESPSPESTEG